MILIYVFFIFALYMFFEFSAIFLKAVIWGVFIISIM